MTLPTGALLVVDDEPGLRDAIVFDYELQGYEVAAASSGNEALELIKKRHFDCVLTDIRMPDGDGIDLLKQIKSINCNGPKVALMSGYAEILLEDAYHLGAMAVIPKPFERKVLLEVVGKALLPSEIAWRPAPVATPPIQLDMAFKTIAEARDASLLALGKGGLFVSFPNDAVRVNSTMALKISFSEEGESATPVLIEGTGVVRWIRKNSETEPAGCGIEFLHLSDNCRAAIVQLTQALEASAYIPKGPK